MMGFDQNHSKVISITQIYVMQKVINVFKLNFFGIDTNK